MGFSDSVRKTSEKMKNQINNTATEIAKDLFETAVFLTPVSDPNQKKRGELKNNWHIGIGIGVRQKSYSTIFNILGTESIQQISTIKNSKEFLGKDGEVSITNIVNYGFRAEYAGWPAPRWKNSHPYAMMRNSLTLVSSKYKK